MSNTMRGRFLLAAVLVAVMTPATLAAQARGVTDNYELVGAGGRSLPVIVSRIVPGEGTTLHSARLRLLPDGRLDGAIVVSVTDSGAVTDTVVARGRCRVDGDTIRVTYPARESQPRHRSEPDMLCALGRARASAWISPRMRQSPRERNLILRGDRREEGREYRREERREDRRETAWSHVDGAPRWLTLLFTPPFTGRFTLLFTFKRPFTSE